MSEVKELWLRYSECKEELPCKHLEAILGIGVVLFQQISSRHAEWFQSVEDKSIPYNVEFAQSIADEFKEWKEATDSWLLAVVHLESQGYQVENARRIREAYEQLKYCDFDVRETYESFERMKKGGGIPIGTAGLTRRIKAT